ncbi:MAG: extracellular solute-binding protein [Myxococcota bacterium]|jgi:arabinogalactan oligomer/maltooligosaccharide transport system permease protein|nr:extracellular solute-binding protein [Myxococcota bacterium]
MSRRNAFLFGLVGIALAGVLSSRVAFADELVVWHSYYGEERAALEAVLDAFDDARDDISIKVLAVPNDGYTNKLVTAIPRGNGPDVFIAPHDQTGNWAQNKIIAPVENDFGPEFLAEFKAVTVEALRFGEHLYGLPLAFKSPVLFYNRDIIDAPPKTTTELFALLEEHTDAKNDRYALVYEETNFFFHALWMHGFGGYIFNEDGEVELANEGNAKSFLFVRKLMQYLPHRVDGARIKKLFNDGDAAMVINGPWFMADLDKNLNYGVATLPFIDESGLYAAPYLTAEGIFLSAETKQRSKGLALMEYIAGEGSVERAVRGQQMVAYMPAYEREELKSDPVAAERRAVFLAQLDHAVPTSNRPEMSALWNPMLMALQKSLYGGPSGWTPYFMLLALLLISVGFVLVSKGRNRSLEANATKRYVQLASGIALLLAALPTIYHIFAMQGANRDVDPMDALREAQNRFITVQAPLAEEANPAPFLAILGLLLIIILAVGAFAWKKHKAKKIEYTDNITALPYIGPAVLAMLALVVVPFVVGAGLSFFAYQNGDFVFVGLQNFERLFSGEGTPLNDSMSFYFTLVVTILWTVLNVALHVTIGVALALILRDPWLKLRGFYRVLLIIPWAVPNYITALIWRGMFDTSFGAINGILKAFGLEPVGWFDEFLTSFAANLTTNTWLGFPFMMVVTLGALQAIPRDLEDAASVDGASRWQRFSNVTLPLLKPALLPSVILGSVWTFNMFNVIYLVSMGNPDSSTEILISEAYKWAFERQYQYGYAAAYALVVFFILVGYSRLTRLLVESK